MKYKLLLTMVLLFALSMAVVAQDDFPSDMLEDVGIEVDDFDLEIDENFSDDDAWDFYIDSENDDEYVYTNDGAFEIRRETVSSFLWGQDNELREYEDSVVFAESEQLSDEDNNGYGLMCRKDPDFTSLDGYGFLITGDGFVRIFRYEDGEAIDLVPWQQSDAVNEGQDDNDLMIACVGEYLAFWVNGELVAEATDDVYDEGVTSFVAVTYEEGEEVHVAFDDLLVWEVDAEYTGSSSSGDCVRTNDGGCELDTDNLTEEIQDMIDDEGDENIDLEDVVFADSFDDTGDWQELDFDNTESEVDDGVYRFEHSDEGFFVSAQNEDDEYEDVVITVTTETFSDHELSAHGIMCRADNDDVASENGYAFLVTNDGFYTVGYWDDNSYTSLLDTESGWDSTNDTETGEGAINQITAVCVGEYIALFVNGELVESFEDDTYDEGFVSVAAVAFDGEEVEVEFDNYVVWEADD